MFNIILKKINGTVTIIVEGYFMEKFLNLCNNRKIEIYNIKSHNSCMIEFDINVVNVKKLREVVKMTKTKMKIVKKDGLPFLLHRYRKRKYVLLVIIFCVLLFLAAQSIIWKIEINVDDEELYQKIELELIKMDVKEYKNKYLMDRKYIKDMLMINIPELTWVELDIKGVVLFVEAKKIINAPIIIDEKSNCNIVANKRGIIDNIIVKSGNVVVKKGDIVETGDILISGYIDSELQDDWLLHAQGDVYAKIWYNASMKVPLYEVFVTYTNNKKVYYGINTKKNKVFFGKLSTIYKEYDTMLKKQNIKIFNYVLPIYFYKYIYQEKYTNVVERTYEEAIEYGKSILIKYLDIQIPEHAIVNDILINTSIMEDGLFIEVTYECIEEIGMEQNIY